jgi:hypothetical protein
MYSNLSKAYSFATGGEEEEEEEGEEDQYKEVKSLAKKALKGGFNMLLKMIQEA